MHSLRASAKIRPSQHYCATEAILVKYAEPMEEVEYRKEFFDRDYRVRDAYKRVWKYARKYKFRLLVGIVAGMLTAGTLVPFFQIVQPALQHVESHDSAVADKAASHRPAADSVDKAASPRPAAQNAFEKQIQRNSKLPSWYPTVEKWAAKCGITLQTE